MKTSSKVSRWLKGLLMGLVAFIWLTPTDTTAKSMNGVSFQVFYDELIPYGDWIKDARYGYVWLPAVHEDFHPYGTNGHWVMTEYGNTWVSDYDWGWATFHYGRWYFDNTYQSWAWIPDYQWGPAWVDWRTGGGYYGWAPMGPGFSVNVRINIPAAYWVFVPQHRFIYRNVYSYHVPRAKRISIYNNTTIINNTTVYNNNRYYAGPRRSEIEKVSRRSYPVRNIQASNKPGRMALSNRTVNVYRPNLQASRGRTVSARPSRVLGSNEARTSRIQSGSSSREEAVTNSPTRSSNRTNRSTGTAAPTKRSHHFGTKPYNSGARPTTSTSPSPRQKVTVPTQNQPRNDRSITTTPRSSSSRQPQAAPAQRRSATPNQRAATSTSRPSSSRDNTRTVQRQSSPSNPARTVRPSSPRTSSPQVRSTPSSNSQASSPRTASRGSRERGN